MSCGTGWRNVISVKPPDEATRTMCSIQNKNKSYRLLLQEFQRKDQLSAQSSWHNLVPFLAAVVSKSLFRQNQTFLMFKSQISKRSKKYVCSVWKPARSEIPDLWLVQNPSVTKWPPSSGIPWEKSIKRTNHRRKTKQLWKVDSSEWIDKINSN